MKTMTLREVYDLYGYAEDEYTLEDMREACAATLKRNRGSIGLGVFVVQMMPTTDPVFLYAYGPGCTLHEPPTGYHTLFGLGAMGSTVAVLPRTEVFPRTQEK